jgi:hypothetical protein
MVQDVDGVTCCVCVGAQKDLRAQKDVAEGIVGKDLLDGIRAIIGSDPNVPPDQVGRPVAP